MRRAISSWPSTTFTAACTGSTGRIEAVQGRASGELRLISGDSGGGIRYRSGLFSHRPSMTIPRVSVLLAAFSLSSLVATAADKPYEVMDYGRFFSASFNNAAGKPAL